MINNLQLATQNLYNTISGRYVTMEHIDSFLSTLNPKDLKSQ